MGFWGTFWLSKDIAKLEALRDMVKDEDDIKAIDRVIALIKENEKTEK